MNLGALEVKQFLLI